MALKASNPDNIVQVKQFVGDQAYPTTSTKSSIEFRVVEGTGPSPLGFGENMRQLASIFSSDELAAGRKSVAAESTKNGEILTLAGLRMRNGLSQKQMADMMQTSQSRVSRLEAGREEPGLRAIEKIATVLECHVLEVFDAFNAVQNDC